MICNSYNQVFSSLMLFTCIQGNVQPYLAIPVCTLKCELKGKKKRGTPCSLERTPGMLGNRAICTPPLTYVSVDESVRNNINQWP